MVFYMECFKLTIPATTLRHPWELYGTLSVLNAELRLLPGISEEEYLNDITGFLTDHSPGVKVLKIGQNHGIKNRDITKYTRISFKKNMPNIVQKLPELKMPFIGRIELHSDGRKLKEVYFFPEAIT